MSADKNQIRLERNLVRAAKNGATKEVSWLLSSHTNLSPDSYGNLTVTPLMGAINYSRETTALALLSHGASHSLSVCLGTAPLSKACSLGLDRVVIKLIEMGANPNGVDHDTNSPLYEALLKGHANICSILLSTGAVDPNAQIEKSNLLEAFHVGRSNIECLQLLREYGLNLSDFNVKSSLIKKIQPDELKRSVISLIESQIFSKVCEKGSARPPKRM